MKKQLLCLFLVLVFCLGYFPAVHAETSPPAEPGGYQVPDVSKMSGLDIVKEVDKEIAYSYLGARNLHYFEMVGPARVGSLRAEWVVKDLKRNMNRFELPMLFSPIMYTPKTNSEKFAQNLDKVKKADAAKDAMGSIGRNYAGGGYKRVPVWGQDIHGRWYIDWSVEQAFWFEHGWSGFRFNGENAQRKRREVLYWINGVELLRKYGNAEDKKAAAKYYGSTFKNKIQIEGQPPDMMNQLIQAGVDEIWTDKKGSQLDFRGLYNRDNEYIHYPSDKLPSGMEWTDVVLIMVPPTYISWGYGVRFSADPSDAHRIYTIDMPIAPINLVLNDLKATFASGSPKSAQEGQPVTVYVEVTSTFEESKDANFRWNISGVDMTAVTFSSGSDKGDFKLGAREKKMVSATFTMPAGKVDVSYEVNFADSAGKRPVKENGNYENNKAAMTLTNRANTQPKPVNIPPWVLTKKVKFNVESSATLVKPSDATWTGPASGSLTVTNGSPTIYNDFKVSNNPAVSESTETITRKPQINAKLDRADFGDDPKGKRFGKNNIQLSKTGMVKGNGQVQRPYSWITYSMAGTPPTMTATTHYGTAHASFSPINDNRSYIFDVYNGIRKLPFNKTFKTAAETGAVKDNGVGIDLAWKGTPIPFDVVRWMTHRDESDNESNWEPVDGQFERTFIGQSTGTLTWKAEMSQKDGYAADRANAASGKTGQSYYKNAVFATDKPLQSIAYPIKSGYYFNPIGEYTCTIKTAQYKDSDDDTDEHAELVEQVKAAFRYSSDLQYIDGSKSVFKLAEVSQDQPKGILKIEDEFDKTATELKTTKQRDGTVDKLLREVMEGYAESGTEDSNKTYKYLERTDKAIYLVEETTVVTFKISVPQGNRLYTHVNMPNGEYGIRIWQEPITVTSASNFKIGKSPMFDGLKVTVRGSIYDDR